MDNLIKKPYELSVWDDVLTYIVKDPSGTILEYTDATTIPEGYTILNQYYNEKKLCVIGSDKIGVPTRAYSLELVQNINGTNTLTFKIGLRYLDEETNEWKENPFIKMLVNERKIKLKYDNEWYDFVIKDIQEDSANLEISYECIDLYINELSKNGFSLEFDTELENNQGAITELAKKIVDGTDWVIDEENSDKLVQVNNEALYKVKIGSLGSENYIYTLPGGENVTNTLHIEGEYVYVPYSVINNKEIDFQFIYVPNDGYIYDSNGKIINENCHYYISNVSWISGRFSVAHARLSETGQATANIQGDQLQDPSISWDTNGEVAITPLYIHKPKPTTEDGWFIIRAKDEMLANWIAAKAVLGANNINIGYNQSRHADGFVTITSSGAPGAFEVSNTVETANKTATDCSGFVWECVREAFYETLDGQEYRAIMGSPCTSKWLKNTYSEKTPLRPDYWQYYFNDASQEKGFIHFVVRMMYDAFTSPVLGLDNYFEVITKVPNNGTKGFTNLDELQGLVKHGDILATPWDPTVNSGHTVIVIDNTTITDPSALIKSKDSYPSILADDTREGTYPDDPGFNPDDGEDETERMPGGKLMPELIRDISGDKYIRQAKGGVDPTIDVVYTEYTSQIDGDDNIYRGFVETEYTVDSIPINLLPDARGVIDVNKVWSAAGDATIKSLGKYYAPYDPGVPGTQEYSPLSEPSVYIDRGRYVYYKNDNGEWISNATLPYDSSRAYYQLNSISNKNKGDIDFYAGTSLLMDFPTNSGTSNYIINRGLNSTINYFKEFKRGEEYMFRFKRNSWNSPHTTCRIKIGLVNEGAEETEDFEVLFDFAFDNEQKQVIAHKNDGAWSELTTKCLVNKTYGSLTKTGYHLEVRFYNAKASDNLSWGILDAQFFKVYRNSVGDIVYPDGNVPLEATIRDRYNFYLPNEDWQSRDDLECVYTGYSPTGEDGLDESGDVKNWGFSPIMDDNCEKINSITAKESNRFNLLQQLCETFECWVKFTIQHDEIGAVLYTDPSSESNWTKSPIKTIVFKEFIGKDNYAGFKYGINLQSIRRSLNSDELVTKLIVKANNNEYGKDGFCTIQRASANVEGTNTILNLDYYINHRLLDKTLLWNDLYSEPDNPSGYLAYYIMMKYYNQEQDLAIQNLSDYGTLLNRYESDLKAYTAVRDTADEIIGDNNETLKANGLDDWTEVALWTQSELEEKYSKEVVKLVNENKQYYGQKEAAEHIIPTLMDNITDTQNLYDNTEDFLNNIANSKKALDEAFFKKYYRFIQEGSWQDESYYDDNSYYFDALTVSKTSSKPNVQYNINVAEISEVEGFENYDFSVGDKTYIEDIEFFGYDTTKEYDTPYKEEVVVAEVKWNLDDPTQNQITVQNYKTQFEDLFQRITAATQSLQFAQSDYARAANAINKNQSLNPDILQNSLYENSLIIANARDQSVVVDDKGITITNLFNPTEQVRLVNNGIVLTQDGGAHWTTGITAKGINASVITAGTINTGLLRIMNTGSDISAIWDSNGITSYARSNGKHSYTKFVRLDGYGLYGYDGSQVDWVPTNINSLNPDNNSDLMFGLTWNNFFFKGEKGGATTLIDGTGITIKNPQGNRVFYIDENGNLHMGISATISWGDVENKPFTNMTWASDGTLTHIDGHTIQTSNIIAGSILSGSFKIGKDSSNVLMEFNSDDTGSIILKSGVQLTVGDETKTMDTIFDGLNGDIITNRNDIADLNNLVGSTSVASQIESNRENISEYLRSNMGMHQDQTTTSEYHLLYASVPSPTGESNAAPYGWAITTIGTDGMTHELKCTQSGLGFWNNHQELTFGFTRDGELYASRAYMAEVYTGTLAADHITAGALNSGVIYSGSINADQIKAGTIKANIALFAPQLYMPDVTYQIKIFHGHADYNSSLRTLKVDLMDEDIEDITLTAYTYVFLDISNDGVPPLSGIFIEFEDNPDWDGYLIHDSDIDLHSLRLRWNGSNWILSDTALGDVADGYLAYLLGLNSFGDLVLGTKIGRYNSLRINASSSIYLNTGSGEEEGLFLNGTKITPGGGGSGLPSWIDVNNTNHYLYPNVSNAFLGTTNHVWNHIYGGTIHCSSLMINNTTFTGQAKFG